MIVATQHRWPVQSERSPKRIEHNCKKWQLWLKQVLTYKQMTYNKPEKFQLHRGHWHVAKLPRDTPKISQAGVATVTHSSNDFNQRDLAVSLRASAPHPECVVLPLDEVRGWQTARPSVVVRRRLQGQHPRATALRHHLLLAGHSVQEPML